MTDDNETTEPRIVQGMIGGITASGLLHFTSPPPDARDAVIMDLQRQLDENALIMEQWHKLLSEMKTAAEMLSGALTTVLDSVKRE